MTFAYVSGNHHRQSWVGSSNLRATRYRYSVTLHQLVG